MAIAAAAVRVSTPSFSYTRYRCFFTVAASLTSRSTKSQSVSGVRPCSVATNWRAPRCVTSGRSARHGHARQHLGRADRLGDAVAAAGIKGREHVLGFGEAGHEHNGDVRGVGLGRRLQGNELEAVDVGDGSMAAV
jgi:hypothetical protein